jgi:hypothetical protein
MRRMAENHSAQPLIQKAPPPDERAHPGVSALVIVGLSALSWAVLILIVVGIRSL